MSYAGETIRDARADDERSFARNGPGRLVEVRIGRLARAADMDNLSVAVTAAIRRVGGRAILCADCRSASPLVPEAADRWAHGMREANRCIALSALLIDRENTMFNLQVERVVRCAGSDDRRVFTDIEDLVRWVGCVATAQEHRGLGAFLSGGGR